MTALTGGILLPESVLSSSWFAILATIVAFNTIVYVGLTLAKIIPLPKQIHPSRVRGWLTAFGTEIDGNSAVNDIPKREAPESTDPYENMRQGIARRDIPQAFALVGGLVILLSVAAIFAYREDRITDSLIELVAGLAFLFISQVLARRNFRARTVMWTWAMASLVLVEILVFESVNVGNQVPLAYALIIMTAFGPVALAWRPTMVAAAIMFISMVVAAFRVPGDEDYRLIVSAFAALLVGGMLLRLRLVALDALSDEKAKSAALASTDVLTGTLTRNGLLSLMPALAGIADRAGQDVCVMFFDINQLAKANEQYGHAYGDDVLKGVADSILSNVRTGDLVARWGGDEFVVAGLGSRPDAAALGARIEDAVRIAGVNLGRWPTTLKAGTAAGDPGQTTFDGLLAEAEAQAGNTPAISAGS